MVAIFCLILSPAYLSVSKETFYFVFGVTGANVVSLTICLIGGNYIPSFAECITLSNILCRGLVVFGLSRMDYTHLSCVPRFLQICRNYAPLFMLMADCVLFKSPCIILITLQVILLVGFSLVTKHHEIEQAIGLCQDNIKSKAGHIFAFAPLACLAIFALVMQLYNEMRLFDATESVQKQQKTLIGLFEKQHDAVIVIE